MLAYLWGVVKRAFKGCPFLLMMAVVGFPTYMVGMQLGGIERSVASSMPYIAGAVVIVWLVDILLPEER